MKLMACSSIRAHAMIISVDPSEALAMEDVYNYVSHNDLPSQSRSSHVILLNPAYHCH